MTTYPTPAELSRSLLRDFGSAKAAAKYAERIARNDANPRLAADYAEAAELLKAVRS